MYKTFYYNHCIIFAIWRDPLEKRTIEWSLEIIKHSNNNNKSFTYMWNRNSFNNLDFFTRRATKKVHADACPLLLCACAQILSRGTSTSIIILISKLSSVSDDELILLIHTRRSTWCDELSTNFLSLSKTIQLKTPCFTHFFTHFREEDQEDEIKVLCVCLSHNTFRSNKGWRTSSILNLTVHLINKCSTY